MVKHSNNSSAICLSVFYYFVGLALKGFFAKSFAIDVLTVPKNASKIYYFKSSL